MTIDDIFRVMKKIEKFLETSRGNPGIQPSDELWRLAARLERINLVHKGTAPEKTGHVYRYFQFLPRGEELLSIMNDELLSPAEKVERATEVLR